MRVRPRMKNPRGRRSPGVPRSRAMWLEPRVLVTPRRRPEPWVGQGTDNMNLHVSPAEGKSARAPTSTTNNTTRLTGKARAELERGILAHPAVKGIARLVLIE